MPGRASGLISQALDLLSTAGENFSVVLSLTETALDQVRLTDGRPTLSRAGRLLRPIHLQPLDEQEFEVAAFLLQKEHKLMFPAGAQFEPLFRECRILRLTAALESSVEAQKGDALLGLSAYKSWVQQGICPGCLGRVERRDQLDVRPCEGHPPA
jgi:hypothetical protein